MEQPVDSVCGLKKIHALTYRILNFARIEFALLGCINLLSFGSTKVLK